MARLLIPLTLALFVCNANGEQILKMHNGEKYLGQKTADHSGIFVDCDNGHHSLADGDIQPTSQTCLGNGPIHASVPTLITISPLEVVSVDTKNKKIEVLEGKTVKVLDLQHFPTQRFDEFIKGSQIGVVTKQKDSESKLIVPQAIFDKDFAVDAKEKEEKKILELLSHPDKGA
jgi:hypothetical protein